MHIEVERDRQREEKETEVQRDRDRKRRSRRRSRKPGIFNSNLRTKARKWGGGGIAKGRRDHTYPGETNTSVSSHSLYR